MLPDFQPTSTEGRAVFLAKSWRLLRNDFRTSNIPAKLERHIRLHSWHPQWRSGGGPWKAEVAVRRRYSAHRSRERSPESGRVKFTGPFPRYPIILLCLLHAFDTTHTACYDAELISQFIPPARPPSSGWSHTQQTSTSRYAVTLRSPPMSYVPIRVSYYDVELQSQLHP